MGEIDVVPARDDRIEIIAADPALHFGKPPLDFARFARGDGEEIAHQRLRRIGPAVVQRSEMRARAVGQHGVDRQHVLARIAVAQRPRAAGIVADHAADGGARRRRYVDREPQARGLQLAIELVEHDARLDRAAAFGGIELDDAVEMRRAVDDERRVDRLARLGRSAAARRHRHAFGAANRDRPFGLLHRARRHHAERRHLVMGRVGGVAPAGEGVEAHVAHLVRPEPSFEARQQPAAHVITSAISAHCHHPPRVREARPDAKLRRMIQ